MRVSGSPDPHRRLTDVDAHPSERVGKLKVAKRAIGVKVLEPWGGGKAVVFRVHPPMGLRVLLRGVDRSGELGRGESGSVGGRCARV